jgi:dTDP-glucose pyrophosphorylase
MTTTQAVILARGLGSRMRQAQGLSLTPEQDAAAVQGAKAMMPFGRPFLDYAMSHLADAGITRAVLVIGPEHQAMRDYFHNTATGRRVNLSFAVQERPLGTADAVRAAEAQVGASTFLVLNGDNLYPTETIRRLAALEAPGLAAFTADSLITGAGLSPERLLKFALLDIDAQNVLQDIHEKPAPDHPLALRRERYVSMNLWSFTSSIFSAIAAITPSPRGELEIQDAVRTDMRANGVAYRCMLSDEPVLDLSSQADIDPVGRYLAALNPRP